MPGRTRRRLRASKRFVGSTARALLFASIPLWSGCASSDADVPERPAAPVSPYLLPPTDGWAGEIDESQRAALAEGFTMLARDGDPAAALAAAEALAASAGELRPAQVLAAQAELVAGAHDRARVRLEGWIAGEPSYRAARLVWARALDLGGEVALAHAEYRALEDQIPIASQRARATREQAVEQAQARVDQALAGGRVDEAREWMDRLVEWEPADSVVVLEAGLRVAQAAGDGVGELAALRSLTTRGRDDRAMIERLAALELEIGDADQALRLLEGLVAKYPGDATLESSLATAQLRFRLRLLPDPVQKLASRGELARGDFAALLYWVVPGVRQTQGSSARIATDVLDHRWQQEIIRVVNRGLMSVNRQLHRFEPDRPITRVEALESALEVAANQPGGECAEDAIAHPSPGASFLCGVAARCGLLDDAADCLPQARLSGGEALEILGRALQPRPEA
jgi:tetratricopeptide (TPR) repeat protein